MEIKYAAMEVCFNDDKEAGTNKIELNYIVSKCYVCEEETIELKRNKTKTIYKVVFPYRNYQRFLNCLENNLAYDEKPDSPRYDANNNLLNYVIVDKVFDTYDDAKIEANEKSMECFLEYWAGQDGKHPPTHPEDKYIRNFTFEYDYVVSEYMETWIDQNTEDLIITNNNTLKR